MVCYRLILGIFFAIFTTSAFAEDRPDQCTAIASNSERLNCFDRLFPSQKAKNVSESVVMSMVDFLTDYRDMGGKTVVIKANLLQTGNMIFIGENWPPILNYAIAIGDKLDRETRRKINKDCSSVNGPACIVELSGVVLENMGGPVLSATGIKFQ